MIIELISRLNIPNVEILTSKKQFAEYMIDIIETNMIPFFTLLRKRQDPGLKGPLFNFKLI